MSTAAQIKRIHVLAGNVGLKKHEYRDLVLVYGAASSKDLDEASADRLIAALAKLPGGSRPSTARAEGRYGKILQALWISAWNLGIVAAKDDKAMMAFVERQTGVSHTRFLVDPADGRGAVEGLKRWIAREGGVAWPRGHDAAARNFAVCRAIAARLQEAGGLVPRTPEAAPWPDEVLALGAAVGLPDALTDYADRDWHRLGNLLGAKLRHQLAEQSKPKRSTAA